MEDVLGRDAKSVFPNESRKAMLDSAPVQALLQGGDRKFISETELLEIKAATGGKGRVEGGSIASDKPLAQVLQEQRDAKEAKFQEQWRQMKTGKNRPLDEDEMEFLDSLASVEDQRQQQVQAQEDAALAEYHAALRQQQEAAAAHAAAAEAAEAAGPGAAGAAKAPKLKTSKALRSAALVKPIIRPKVQRAAVAAAVEQQPAAKRQRSEAASAADVGGGGGIDSEPGGGLAGLLGGYGSDSSQE